MARFVLSVLRWSGWRDVVARLPLPMLALAASYGVYRFAAMFVPEWVAIVQAAAFELVYIGLAVVKLSPDQQRRAQAISIGAVVVSMIYNSLDGLFHLRPALLDAPPLWLHVSLALLHGIPLALLAYLVADLLLHQSHVATKSFGALPSLEAKPNAGGRPALYSVDGLLSAVAGEDTFSREVAMQRLGCSASVIDRLLAEGVQLGQLVRVERGIYRRLSASA